jgi:hypothetical protein
MHRDERDLHLVIAHNPPASTNAAQYEGREGLLDSWKEIASFLGREVRTVQLWEKREGLPVHRHFHVSRASVHAYSAEIVAWQKSRRMRVPDAAPSVVGCRDRFTA